MESLGTSVVASVALLFVIGLMTACTSAEQAEPAPGTGGWAIYRFQAVSAGESALRLLYHQPWTEQEPIGVYAVRVVAR